MKTRCLFLVNTPSCSLWLYQSRRTIGCNGRTRSQGHIQGSRPAAKLACGRAKLLWTYDEAGVGYSGPAIVGDKLVIMGSNGEKESVFTLDVRTGKKGWSTDFAQAYTNNYGDGPRGTPTIDGDRVYVLSGHGILACLELETGKILWKKSLPKDLGGRLMSGWGFSESPLIDGDKLVCTPGGDQGTVAALDKKTGEVLWRSKEYKDACSYASLVISNAGGIKQYVVMTGDSTAGVAAEDGQLLWRFDRPSPVAAVPTPVVQDDLVYVTSGYRTGCHLLKISKADKGLEANEVYANKGMENHHGGVILIDGYLYGNSNNGGWKCQNLKTGKFAWENRKLGKGCCTCAGGRLYLYTEKKGEVVLLEPSPKAWKEHGRFTIPSEAKIRKRDGGIWTHPVVANGRLYLRDQNLIFCYDVHAE